MENKLLETLREKNPGLPLFDVRDPEFARYGRVLPLTEAETADLARRLDQVAIPAQGNVYFPSEEGLEGAAALPALRRRAFGMMPVQAGFCNGQGHCLNAMEYHRCSEVNFTTTGLVLLLALPEALHDGAMDSGDVVGFYLPPMTAVEVLPLVLHFAPCKIAEAGFNCLVILEKDTNTPISGVDTGADGEQKLLWMRNKWLTCHPDSPQAGEGAYVGITGENIVLSL